MPDNTVPMTPIRRRHVGLSLNSLVLLAVGAATLDASGKRSGLTPEGRLGVAALGASMAWLGLGVLPFCAWLVAWWMRTLRSDHAPWLRDSPWPRTRLRSWLVRRRAQDWVFVGAILVGTVPLYPVILLYESWVRVLLLVANSAVHAGLARDIWRLGRLTLRDLRGPRVELRIERFPFFTGDEAVILLRMNDGLRAARRVEATLSCIGFQEPEPEANDDEKAWEEFVQIIALESESLRHGPPEIPLRFSIPASAPGTKMVPWVEWFWDLEVRVETNERVTFAPFHVPVYDRPDED